MKRNIYILLLGHYETWFESFSKWCCVHVNPTWKIHCVTKETLSNFIPSETFHQIKKLSDYSFYLIMIYLVAYYGGICFLPHLLCKKSFDELENSLPQNEFGFYHREGILISRFVNPFLKQYLDSFLGGRKSILSLDPITDKVENVYERITFDYSIHNPKIVKVAKLHGFKMIKDELYTFKSFTVNLFPSLSLLHVGKCGGTSIVYHFLNNGIHLQQYHLDRPFSESYERKYFLLWIRNPFTRFVSAFYHAKNRLEGDLSIVPYRNHDNFVFSNSYDNLISQYKTANELAEHMSHSHPNLRKIALQCMHHPEEHIYKGLGYYTNNGEFIRKNQNRIFIGRLEHFEEDLKSFIENKLKIPFSFHAEKKIRENKNKNDRFLSKKALENLFSFYKETDFKALQVLLECNLIPKSTFESYMIY